jgi:type I restriction enzyme S subunit
MRKDYYGGNIPWLKTGDLTDGYIYEIPETITDKALEETSVKLNPTGSVLIAMYGATIGKIGILTFPATTNQACCACVDYKAVTPKYLFNFLLSHKEEFVKMGGGGAQPNISKEKIISTLIPIPPIAEQNRITDEIERLITYIEAIELNQGRLEQSLKLCKERILDMALSGKLIPQDQDDEPAVELLRMINPLFAPTDNRHYENIPFELPETWLWVTLSDISNYGECANVSVDKISNESWVLELEDIEKDSGRLLQRMRKSDRTINGVRHSFQKGDVLYSKLRTYLNKVLVADQDGYCTTEIIPITCVQGIVPEYLCHVLRSKYYVDYTISLGYGVKMPRLGTGDALKSMIPVPPYEEQRRIVKSVNEIYHKLEQISSEL